MDVRPLSDEERAELGSRRPREHSKSDVREALDAASPGSWYLAASEACHAAALRSALQSVGRHTGRTVATHIVSDGVAFSVSNSPSEPVVPLTVQVFRMLDRSLSDDGHVPSPDVVAEALALDGKAKKMVAGHVERWINQRMGRADLDDLVLAGDYDEEAA